jgi:putative transposase
MARRVRYSDAGYVYHVLNRAAGRATIFKKPDDYAAFEKILQEAWERSAMRLLSYVVMPNHWHLVVRPKRTETLSSYVQWLTVTHVRRWHAHHHTSGTGPIYQGRFKSFPVQEDEHLLTLCRYVERNPLRAKLVKKAEHWRWSSLWHRTHATGVPWLSEGPLAVPTSRIESPNAAQTAAELEALRRSVARGAPFGNEAWQEKTAKALQLESSLRPRGRPKKAAVSPEKEI